MLKLHRPAIFYDFAKLCSMSASQDKYDGRVKKRQWVERRTDQGEALGLDEGAKKIRADFERTKRRKFALINPQMKTIEEELLTALLKCDFINEEAFKQVQAVQFQRAARTDKGVSAAMQLVSLKLPETVDIKALNENLPEEIRVFSAKRVTKGFNSKSHCDARTYMYMLPTISFAKNGQEVDMETYRTDAETVQNVNEVLQMFIGTKNFHNFTSKKRFADPSANRYVISFDCEAPFVRNNTEFAVLKVKGQSFMLHQIRKMIGLALAVVRGLTSAETISKTYTAERFDVPMAPGLGLVLERLHYDKYNAKYGSDHATLDFADLEETIADFKEKYIYSNIVQVECDERPMAKWLETLPLHSYGAPREEVAPTPAPLKHDEEVSSSLSSDNDNSREDVVKVVV